MIVAGESLMCGNTWLQAVPDCKICCQVRQADMWLGEREGKVPLLTSPSPLCLFSFIQTSPSFVPVSFQLSSFSSSVTTSITSASLSSLPRNTWLSPESPASFSSSPSPSSLTASESRCDLLCSGCKHTRSITSTLTQKHSRQLQSKQNRR